MPSGGYRAPQNPAPVGGPGSLSRRTDGGPADKQPIRNIPNAGYGEQAEFRGIQGSAPMRQAAAPAQSAPAPRQLPLPLDAPSMRGDEPVTAGANAGDGPDQSALGIFDPADMAGNSVAYMKRFLPTLQAMVDRDPRASHQTRALVRHLRSL